jgi:putative ABC transport system permease protein
LTPTINALSVTGIVHIPGMMTGQILAGQSPFQAAAYQVLIFFLIASQACTTVQILMKLTQ